MTNMDPQHRTNELITRLKSASGPNLESVILYGSAASSEFDPSVSDLNVLCILRETSFAALQALAPVMKWWHRREQSLPLFMTREELERSADVFAIEILDMRQQYKVLFGSDVLQGLRIPMDLHRVQVEYELREKLLLLRQRVIAANAREADLRDLLLESLPSFLTLFRHALIALGEASAPNKREAVNLLARRVGFDPASIHQALDVRERKTDLKKTGVQALFAAYLMIIEQVAAAVDRMLDDDKSKRVVP